MTSKKVGRPSLDLCAYSDSEKRVTSLLSSTTQLKLILIDRW